MIKHNSRVFSNFFQFFRDNLDEWLYMNYWNVNRLIECNRIFTIRLVPWNAQNVIRRFVPTIKKSTRYGFPLSRTSDNEEKFTSRRLWKKQYSSYISNVTLCGLSLPRVYFVPRLKPWTMPDPLSLQYGRNACQHRLAGHFLSCEHRSIDVTYNAAKAETEWGLFSWPRPAGFSLHQPPYEAIESSAPPPSLSLSLSSLSFCAFSIGMPESRMKRQRRGKGW